MRMRWTIGLSLALLVVGTAAMARQAEPGHHHPMPSAKAKAAKTKTLATKADRKRQQPHDRTAARAERQRTAVRQVAAPRREAQAVEPLSQPTVPLPVPDRYIGPLRVVGARQIGNAAWYGRRHLGHRTASGEPLDAVHPTAAHRSLPLHSLVRVTNLSNGRSVIATINDRGPVSRSLLIDVSPSAAQQLDMMSAGIATVSVEPLAPAATATAAASTR